jgi:hypothetical protein
MSDDKILKIPMNQEVEIRLKKTEPFWTGTDSYEKKRYGYEIDDITGKEKFYCSETLHELIQVSKVGAMVAFKLMLKNENNKSVWLISLDGKDWKSKFQLMEDDTTRVQEGIKSDSVPDWGTINKKYHKEENNAGNNSNESVNIDTPNSNDRPDFAVEIQKMKDEFNTRIAVLEKRITANQARPEPVKESDIPF